MPLMAYRAAMAIATIPKKPRPLPIRTAPAVAMAEVVAGRPVGELPAEGAVVKVVMALPVG